MNKQDKTRLTQLMAHYKIPYTQSHALLKEERKKHDNGDIPMPEWRTEERGEPEEFQGPFFCRIINELLEARRA